MSEITLSKTEIKVLQSLEAGHRYFGTTMMNHSEIPGTKTIEKLIAKKLVRSEMNHDTAGAAYITDEGRAYLASLTPAIIEEPAADEIELDAPTDATLGDILYEQDEIDCKWDGKSELQEGDIVIIPDDEGEDFYGRIVNLEGEKKWFVITDKDGNQDVNESDQYYVRRVYAWADPIPNRWAVKADVPVLPLPYEETRAPEILPEVAPLPAANMYTSAIAAKDAYIAQLEARVKELEARISHLEGVKESYELPFEEESQNYNADALDATRFLFKHNFGRGE